MVLCSLEKSRGKGSSKKQKVAESPPSGEVSVQDILVGLSDEVKWLWKEVKWLWKEVKQQGEWIFSLFEVLPGNLKEERIYPEQDPEGSN